MTVAKLKPATDDVHIPETCPGDRRSICQITSWVYAQLSVATVTA